MTTPPVAGGPVRLTAFAAMWFAYFATVGLFNPYAPLWFKDLGFSTLAIGAIASMQSWTRVLAPYAWGWLGDRGGRRVEAIRWAAGLSLLAAAGLWQWPGAAAVVLFTAALFAANGGVIPLSEAALSQHLQQGGSMDYARYGRIRVWGSLGFVVAASSSGLVLEWLGMSSFPVLVVAAFGLLWLASLRLPPSVPAAAHPVGGPSVWHVLRRPEVAWFFCGVFFTVLAHIAIYAFLSLYLDELGHGKGVVGAAWAVAVAVEIVFFWFQGRIFSRLKPLQWLQWAAGLTALRLALVAAFGAWLPVLLATQLLHAFTFAAQHAACIALLNQHFPGAMRGRGQALYSMLGYGCAGVVGGLAGGWLGSRYGFSAVFWAASAAAVLGSVALRAASRAERRAVVSTA
jgi:PPP family 3-phenylpropionic acid transporter